MLYPLKAISAKRAMEPRHRADVVYRDSLGEFVLRALLKHHLGLKVAGRAAKGLTYDLIEISASDSSRRTVTWTLEFESKLDATECKEALNLLMGKIYGLSVIPHASEWRAELRGGMSLSMNNLDEHIVTLTVFDSQIH